MLHIEFWNQIKLPLLATICILISSCASDKHENGIPPDEALSTFQLADGFQIELIASEPLIGDPVAMMVDEQGDMYVLEMHGYPLDLSGSGVIRILEDKDQDGIMDHSKVFADDLLLPTGLMKWKNGLLVTDPPHVLYLEDTDKDGKADRRDTLMSGFALSNPQHNLNSPQYGIDNWIYINNEEAYTAKVYPEKFGNEGSDVIYTNHPDAGKLPNNAHGRNLRIKPDDFEMEELASYSQYGHSFDTWGRHLMVSNANHIYHEVVSAPYLKRNPQLLVSNATASIAEHGPAAEVYPITEDPDHQLLTDIGVFTSACGINYYQGGLFPDEYDKTTFVAEPVANLVHTDVLEDKGATFTARRQFDDKEFLASTDFWFRPVSTYIGPDGALYIIDYYRQIVEHPEWMADDVIESGALYHGTDQGRIYRISPEGSPPLDWSGNAPLGEASTSELTEYLASDNIWFRINAQRLIVDRKPRNVVPILKEMINEGEEPLSVLHALWTLEGMDELSPELIISGLNNEHPGVRENAIIMSEKFLNNQDIVNTLISMDESPDHRTLFQLLCTLGYVESSEAARKREQILFDHVDDYWLQVAALSARKLPVKKLLTRVIDLYNSNPDSYGSLTTQLGAMIGGQKDPENIRFWINRSIENSKDRESGWQAALLEGISTRIDPDEDMGSNFDKTKIKLANVVLDDRYHSDVREGSLSLLRAMGSLSGVMDSDLTRRIDDLMHDPSANPEKRALAIKLIGLDDSKSEKTELSRLLKPSEPLEVQLAVLNVLGEMSGTAFSQQILDRWQTLTPEVRDESINILMQSQDRILLLISSMEKGIVDPASVGWRRSVELMAQPEDESVRSRARSLFMGSRETKGREEVIMEYDKAVNLEGDAEKGKLVFEQSCSTCHQINGSLGVDYGPDLGTIRNRRPASILRDILDPNLSIADGYDMWKISLKSGEIYRGIIATEAVNALTLKISMQDEVVLDRKNIESIESQGISLMVEGLENQISVEEMGDLLAFLKNPAL